MSTPTDGQRYLTTAEAATMLSMSPVTVRALIRGCHLQASAVRSGPRPHWRIALTEIERYMAERVVRRGQVDEAPATPIADTESVPLRVAAQHARIHVSTIYRFRDRGLLTILPGRPAKTRLIDVREAQQKVSLRGRRFQRGGTP